MHDRGNVGLAIASLTQDLWNLLDIRDGVEIAWGLLNTIPPVKIGPNCHVVAVAGKLADVINVVHDIRERDPLVRGNAADPIGSEHPRIHHGTDDAVTFNKATNHGVIKLTVSGNERAAIRMAGEDTARKPIKCVVKALVGQVRHVQHHADMVRDTQEFPSLSVNGPSLSVPKAYVLGP